MTLTILSVLLYAACSGFYFGSSWVALAFHQFILWCDPKAYQGIIVSAIHKPQWIRSVVYLICALCWVAASGIWLWRAVQAAGQGVTW